MKPDKARAHHLAQLAQGRRLIVAAEKGLRALARHAAAPSQAAQKRRTVREPASATPTDDPSALGRL